MDSSDVGAEITISEWLVGCCQPERWHRRTVRQRYGDADESFNLDRALYSAIQTMCFSCVLNPEEASIYVHWRQRWIGNKNLRQYPFVCAEIKNFRFRKLKHVAALNAAFLNYLGMEP